MYFDIKQIDAHELASWLEEKGQDMRLIDVRQPYEFAAGTIPGAEMMPLGSLPTRAWEIEKDKPVVIICQSGNRSAQACAYLTSRGHRNVYNLRGGVLTWARSGLPYTLPQTA
jgi:rhodanese-related sulfurtransferase